MLEEIGMRVKMARITRQMSQAQLAATLDVSIPYISHIEQGKQAMSVVTLHSICDKLEMDLTYIANPSVWEDLKIILFTIYVLFAKESTEGVDANQVTALSRESEEKSQPA